MIAFSNDLDTPTSERERKLFATLAAEFALMGFALFKGDPSIEGQAPYFATRWGIGAQAFEDLDAARAYLSRLARTDRGQG